MTGGYGLIRFRPATFSPGCPSYMRPRRRRLSGCSAKSAEVADEKEQFSLLTYQFFQRPLVASDMSLIIVWVLNSYGARQATIQPPRC